MRWKKRREDSESEDSDDEPALPDGWESYKTDELHKTRDGYKKHRYYYNTLTRQTTWTKPALSQALPHGWTEHDDNGTRYYMNELTGESSWERPEDRRSEIAITITNDSFQPAPPSNAPPAAKDGRKEKPAKQQKARAPKAKQMKRAEEASSS